MGKVQSRALFIALAALLILALALPAAAPHSQEGVHPASTYMSSRDGAKALFLVLERLGFQVERRTVPLGDLGSARLALVLGPEGPVNEDEADIKSLVRWVKNGGTLIYAASMADLTKSPVGKAFGFRLVPKLRLATTERHVSLAHEYAPARKLAIMGDAQIAAGRGKDDLTSITVGDDTVMQRVVGDGRVIAIAEGNIASNEMLGEDDNALFFALLADRYGAGQPIVFDEYAHGMSSFDKLLPIARGPATAALLLALLGMLLYALGAGKRLGPPSGEPAPPRRSTIEQVTALARLYERTGSRRLALTRLGALAPGVVSSDAELVRLARDHEALRKV
jgi:Domain of unknown function (DUF4350)